MNCINENSDWVRDGNRYHFAGWTGRGIAHGFLGADWNFSSAHLAHEKVRFCELFGVDALLLPAQIHGNVILRVDNSVAAARAALIGEGDGVLVADTAQFERPVAIGVRTADCVPLLMRCEGAMAVVHAGWRGLAAGIIQSALRELRRCHQHAEVEILIGPAAGALRYEVGQEVIDALGPCARFSRGAVENGKLLLSLTETALNIVRHHDKRHRCQVLDLCTMTCKDFHSHRRDKEAAGRNLAFVVCGHGRHAAAVS